MQHFLVSREHEARLRVRGGSEHVGEDEARERAAAGSTSKLPRPSSAALAAHTIRRAAAQEAVEFLGSTPLRCATAAGDTRYKQDVEQLNDRLEWREQVDRKLKRLVHDVKLDLDDNIPKVDQHRLRCEHLDKAYDWYTRHGRKEAKKEKEPPRFLNFNPEENVMAGSLRTPVVSPAYPSLLGSVGSSQCPQNGSSSTKSTQAKCASTTPTLPSLPLPPALTPCPSPAQTPIARCASMPTLKRGTKSMWHKY
jgi:hypothetical protein